MSGWRGIRLALAVLALPAAAWAWYPLGGDLWRDGSVRISFGLTPATPRSGQDWEGAVREAANAWNASLQRIQLEVVPPAERVWYENGHNEVFFDREIYGQPFPSGVLGISFATHDRGQLIENDVVINAGYNWSIYHGPWQSGAKDFRRVVVHELGHVLGLDHPDENGQTVSAIMHSTAGTVETPTSDDQAGARALYEFGPGMAPIIVAQSTAVTVTQGNTARMGVYAAGRGLRYEWHRDGVPVQGATAADLRFVATLGDAGGYSVRVTNDAGTVTSRDMRLSVTPAVRPQAASVSSAPSGTIPAGTDVTLTAVLAQGTAPLTYEWKKDDARLALPNASSVTLKDVQFSDGGNYTVTVTNVAGTITSAPLSLAVAWPVAPRVVHSETAATLGLGGFVTLTAPVDLSQPLQYQWLKDGIVLPGQTGSTFSIASYTPDQAGRYSVVVTNSFGSVTMPAAEVTGYPPSDFMIARQPGAVTEEIGRDVSFAVEVSRPASSYQWFKNGVPLAATPGVSGVRSPALLLERITAESAGVYSVEVGDGTRRLRSQDARLVVLPPVGAIAFTTHPASHSVTLGGQVTLSVAVSSTSNSWTFQWLKDGTARPGATASTLSFSATAGDAGRYRLRATSGPTTIESEEALVEIVTSPRRYFSTHPASSVLYLGSERLRLTAISDEVAWRRAEREGEVYYYTRNGERVVSAYAETTPSMATYTMTRGVPGAIETSQPFTVAIMPPQDNAIIRQHPRGGAFALGTPVTLEARLDRDEPIEWFKDGSRLLTTGPNLVFAAFQARDVGVYTAGTGRSIRSTSEPALVEILGFPSPLIRLHPLGRAVAAGELVQLFVTTPRSDLRYQWFKGGVAVAGETRDSVRFIASAATTGQYHVVVSDGVNTQTSRVATVSLAPSTRAPEILSQPSSLTVAESGDAELSAVVDGSPPPDRYQWFKNGVAIPGANDARLKLRRVQGDAAGAYTVVVSNAAGTTVSQPALVRVDERAQLVNLATRATVGLGTDVLVAGFTISGTAKRTVLVRGIGDQLSEFGVSGVLRDPVVKIFNSNAQLLASNDDWFRSDEETTRRIEEAARQAGAFAQRSGARDAAVLLTLDPGSYTAQVSGLVETTGIALVEIYDVSAPAAGRLVNLSSRAVVGTDANVLIPGLVLRGTTPRRVLIRAVGPGLTDFGITGALADPRLTVLRGTERVAENDNWGEGPGSAGVSAAGAAVGAFPLRAGSRDAAVLLELPAGSYTVQVSGAQRTTGPALVEVYELP